MKTLTGERSMEVELYQYYLVSRPATQASSYTMPSDQYPVQLSQNGRCVEGDLAENRATPQFWQRDLGVQAGHRNIIFQRSSHD